MSPGKRVRLGVIQMQSRNDLKNNLSRAVERIHEAAEAGADVVALPENFAFMGSDEERAGVAQDLEGEILNTLQTVARASSVILLGGSFLVRSTGNDPRPYNTSVLLDREGRLAGVYRKIHLFDVSIRDDATYRESAFIQAGEKVVTATLEGITFGLSICYDLRFPELYRALARQGAQIVFVPSAFTMTTGKDHWAPLLQARAIENQVYMVAPAQFGRHDEKRQTYGRSAIVDPWGTILVQAPDRECVILADFDEDVLADVRSRMPVHKHQRPELFESLGSRSGPDS